MKFSPDGRYLLASGRDKVIWLWEVESGLLLRRFVGHGRVVNSVAFSPDGRRFLSGSLDKTMRLWDVETGQEIHKFTTENHSTSIVAYSPDGRYALSAGGSGWENEVSPVTLTAGDGDYAIRIWRLPDESKLPALYEHTLSLTVDGISQIRFDGGQLWVKHSAGAFPSHFALDGTERPVPTLNAPLPLSWQGPLWFKHEAGRTHVYPVQTKTGFDLALADVINGHSNERFLFRQEEGSPGEGWTRVDAIGGLRKGQFDLRKTPAFHGNLDAPKKTTISLQVDGADDLFFDGAHLVIQHHDWGHPRNCR